MKKRTPSIPLTAVAIGLSLLLSQREASALANDLLEPDVMLLIDTSGSMDWRDATGRPDGVGQWEWARQACEANASNQEDRTSWQKLHDAFLGEDSV